MKLHEVAERLGMEILVPGNGLQQQVTGGCTADLPSEALGRLAAGTVWITSRVHRNAIAVAAPILAEGDVLGCVMFLSHPGSPAATDLEFKLAQTVAGFLGRQMEG